MPKRKGFVWNQPQKIEAPAPPWELTPLLTRRWPEDYTDAERQAPLVSKRP